MRNKMIAVFLILTLFWMGVVFSFSAENAADSKQTSLAFMEKVAEFFDLNITNKEAVESFLRSFAHFGLYLCGGAVSMALFIVACPRRKYLFCIVFGSIYAVLDEIHQIFVPGRAFEVKDIFIDLAGFMIGAVAVVLMNEIRKKIMKWVRTQ